MKISFTRHGETDRNKNNQVNPGEVDSILNHTGIQQAEVLWEVLKNKNITFDYIIVSSLSRAVQTAEIIADKIWFSDELILLDSLKEFFAWVFKEYYKDEFKKEFGVSRIQDVLDAYPENTFEWVESQDNFHNRILSTLESIKNTPEYQNKKILIVAHGWVARVITGINGLWNCEFVEVEI